MTLALPGDSVLPDAVSNFSCINLGTAAYIDNIVQEDVLPLSIELVDNLNSAGNVHTGPAKIITSRYDLYSSKSVEDLRGLLKLPRTVMRNQGVLLGGQIQ